MTVKEIMNVTGCSRATINRKIKDLYPDIINNGIKTELTTDHALNLIGELRKKGIVKYEHTQNEYLPSQNEKLPSQNEKLPSKNVIDQQYITKQDMIEYTRTIVQEIFTQIVPLIKQSTQIEMKQDYYTILGYCRLNKIELSYSEAIRYGKEARKLSLELGYDIRKVDDERYGKVGSYNISVLSRVFEI